MIPGAPDSWSIRLAARIAACLAAGAALWVGGAVACRSTGAPPAARRTTWERPDGSTPPVPHWTNTPARWVAP